MKLPSLLEKFENEQAPFSRNSKGISLENKWVAFTQKPLQIIAWARSYMALHNKLKKDQKQAVTVLKVPKFDAIP